MYNFTEDAHPIHLHLVRFQVLGREAIPGFDQPIEAYVYDSTDDASAVALIRHHVIFTRDPENHVCSGNRCGGDHCRSYAGIILLLPNPI